MINDSTQYDFFEEYVALKGANLMTVMNQLIERMQKDRCTIRHFKQWEAEMTAFKEEYCDFRKNILKYINDIQDESEELFFEKMVSSCCEKMEDRYEILAQIFLERSNEIKSKTTYFETKQEKSASSGFSLKQLLDRVDIHIIRIKMKR